MTFQWSLILFVIIMFTFNITEFECSKGAKGGKGGKKTSAIKNKTQNYVPAIVTEFPLGISDVWDDASSVFKKIISKMVAKKKLIGMESGWYW